MYARFISNLKKQQPIKKVETRKKKLARNLYTVIIKIHVNINLYIAI